MKNKYNFMNNYGFNELNLKSETREVVTARIHKMRRARKLMALAQIALLYLAISVFLQGITTELPFACGVALAVVQLGIFFDLRCRRSIFREFIKMSEHYLDNYEILHNNWAYMHNTEPQVMHPADYRHGCC